MKIIVDTNIWSLALRRNSITLDNAPFVNELKNLIKDSRVQMLGSIRQELLSGITSQVQFNKLQHYLQSFPDLTITSEDHILAAKYFNTCRAKGIQGSAIDFLICASSTQNKLPIYTADKDFVSYSKVIPIVLHMS